MLDFTSVLYLGFWHASAALRPWARLTTGVPAALREPPGMEAVAGRLAQLQGCERGILAPSTLHLFWDLFGMLAREGVALYVDAGAYPIGRWGTLHAAVRGVPVVRFPHRDMGVLKRRIAGAPNLKPVVVADGVCVCCGTVAPVAAYMDVIQPYGGLLVLDDTQSLGLMGRAPAPHAPYGSGGGGSLQHAGVRGHDVLLVSSLAKGFGVPVAALSGRRGLVERFEAHSQTRVHCSPPSAADIHAAERALALNARVGDRLRRRLAERVRLFRQQLQAAGLSASGGLFPVQSLPPMPAAAADRLHARLLGAGVQTVLLAGRDRDTARITFVITARHRPDAIERAVGVLAGLARGVPPRQPGRA